MRILFGKFLNNTRPGKMLSRIKCFIFLLVLQCPPSLLIPLAQQDADSTSEANDLLVPGSIEQVFLNISKATDLIQQIDVKDVANQVISNINDVVVGGESIDTIIPELHNRVANETQSNALINEINTVSNGTEINGNVTSDLVLNSSESLTNLNNNESTNSAEENDGNVHTVELLTLKPTTDTRNTIIDVKFRRSGSQNLENNSDDVNKDAAGNNDSLESSPADNVTLANSNNTAVEKPAFRMLLQEKLRKLKQVSNIVTETNDNKDLNFVLKLLPEIQPLSIDINQLPLNNLVGGALSFMKRFKRDEKGNYPWNSNCKFKKINGRKLRTCKETKELTISTRKSLFENISKVLKLYNPDYLLCPLSVILKVLAQQVLDRIIKSDSDGLLKQILTSFLRGEENTINLVTKELPYLPIPVNLSLQLVHGKIKDFIGLIGDFIDATLCAL